MECKRPRSPGSTTSSRREFLRGAAAIAALPVLGGGEGCGGSPPAPTPAVAAPAEAAGALRKIAVDMHNHVYPAGTEPHPQRGPRPGGAPGGGGNGPPGGGPPGGGPPGGGGPREPEAEVGPELSLAETLKRSGFTAVCASFVLDFAANETPGDAHANLLRWFTAIDTELEKGHLHRALDRKDLERARDGGAPTIIQSVEGAHFIEGDLARVDEVYGRGLRHLQLLHDKDDLVAPLGDTNTGVAHLGGLTPVGVEVVKRCNRLGIVVDLAHGSEATVRAALKVATAPLIVSHTNLDTWTGDDPRMAQMMKSRSIGKGSAKAVADAGGVVGVWTHLTKSLPDLVGSIKAMVHAIGVDHVGIGTDTDLLSRRTGQSTNLAHAGLTRGLFVEMADEMRRQGFTAEDVDKIGGGNYCRVFEKATGRG